MSPRCTEPFLTFTRLGNQIEEVVLATIKKGNDVSNCSLVGLEIYNGLPPRSIVQPFVSLIAEP